MPSTVPFSDVVRHLQQTHVAAIVTRRSNGTRVATPIWAMIVDGVPYIRSAAGSTAWWYRHVRAGRDVEFVLADGSVAERDRAAALLLPTAFVALEDVPAGDPVQAQIDAVLWSKYAGEPTSIGYMVSPRAVACTLRVVPPATDS